MRRLGLPASGLAWGLGLALALAAGQVVGQVVGQVAGQPAAPARAGANDPELQLQAIKAALLAAVDQAPTRVLSTAWVDTQGSLRETTVYNTDTRIQGARVLSYLQQGPETHEQRVQRMAAEVALPPHLRKPGKDGSCPAAGSVRWRMPLLIEHGVQPGTRAQDHAVGLWLSRQLDQLSADLGARSARWYAVPSVTAAPPQQQGTYWHTYLGRSSQAPDWRLRVRILPEPDSGNAPLTAVREWASNWLPVASPQQDWRIEFVLQQDGQAPVWQWQSQLHLGQLPSDHAAAMAVDGLRERLLQAIAALDRETECVVVQYALRPVQHETGAVWQIPAGEGSRLRAGDRVLVFDRQSLPSRVYEAESMRRVGLAEVTRAGLRHAELRQLAGPPLPLSGDWVAVPL